MRGITIEKSYKSGLTLVELVITIAIIGIMSAMAFPYLMSFVRDGEIKSEVRKVVDTFKVARMRALQDGKATSVTIGKNKLDIIQDSKPIKSAVSEYPTQIFFSCNYQTITFGSDGIIKTDTSAAGKPTVIITNGKKEFYVEVKPSGLAEVTEFKAL